MGHGAASYINAPGVDCVFNAPSRPGQRAANDCHDEKISSCKVLVISCVHLECLDTEKSRIRDRGKL
jgi:hypothetical protein